MPSQFQDEKFINVRDIGKKCYECDKITGYCKTCEKNLCKNCHRFI